MRLKVSQVFLAILFISLFLMTIRPITDPDFWWHLRTGQLIVQSHSIPKVDPFSFTNHGKPWIDHEWLSQVVMYGLFRLGGYALLVFVFSAIITISFLLTYYCCPAKTRPYVAGFSLLLGALTTAPTWDVRPQMISLLLTSLLLFLLNQYQKNGKLSSLVPIPIIALLWVNLHAGYFLGFVIIAIYIIGAFIELLIIKSHNSPVNDAPAVRHIVFLSGALGCSILLSLINPNGYHILIYPFQTLTSQAMQQFIQEWLSPDFHLLIWQPLAIFILALICAGMIGKHFLSATKIILTIVFAMAALHSARFIPLFAIVAIPILAEQLGASIRIDSDTQILNKNIRLLVTAVLFLLILVTGFRFKQVIEGQSNAESQIFPRAAVDWIIDNKPEGNLFNSYGWGGYLIWRLYPDLPVQQG